jgi:hypothetical protein
MPGVSPASSSTIQSRNAVLPASRFRKYNIRQLVANGCVTSRVSVPVTVSAVLEKTANLRAPGSPPMPTLPPA